MRTLHDPPKSYGSKDVLPCFGHDNPGSVRLLDIMGSDTSIVRSARVSYDADWCAGEDTGSDTRLINFLMEHRHTTPFESVQFAFEVKAPIFVFRQWHRHRTWSFNEMSARYTELDEGYYLPHPEKYGQQAKGNKQVRDIGSAPVADADRWSGEQMSVIDSAIRVYKNHLDQGMPRELARMVLPVAVYSRMHCSIDLHNLFHFLKLRLHPHAQYEIRVYAEAMLELIEPWVPVAVAAFRKHQLGQTGG